LRKRPTCGNLQLSEKSRTCKGATCIGWKATSTIACFPVLLFVDVLKPFFTMPGMMPVHMLTTPVIEADVAAGRGAGMWQTLGCNSFPASDGGLEAVWQQGTYDNLYVVEQGEWRILRMRWLANFRTRFDRGWVREPLLQLPSLDQAAMPEAIRPDLPGSAAFEGYDPAAVRVKAPQPPERT